MIKEMQAIYFTFSAFKYINLFLAEISFQKPLQWIFYKLYDGNKNVAYFSHIFNKFQNHQS